VLGTPEAVVAIDDQTMMTMNKNAAFKWDLGTDQLVKSYRAHAKLTEASFSFDGRFVATGSRSVKIWNSATGQALEKLESPRPIHSVQFAPLPLGPTKYVFATGGNDGIARLWSWDPKKREITPLDENAVPAAGRNESRPIIRRVRFSPQGDRLFVVGDNGLARLRDLNQPAASISLDVPEAGDFTCAAFSKDGSCIAAGGTDKMVRIWQLPGPGRQPTPPIVLAGHADTINDVALLGESASELRVMSASSDDSARVWDPRLGDQHEHGNQLDGREVISLRHIGDVTAIDVTKDGQLLMTGGIDGTVILWPAAPPSAGNLFDALSGDNE
jgi:WD40 repeat protein